MGPSTGSRSSAGPTRRGVIGGLGLGVAGGLVGASAGPAQAGGRGATPDLVLLGGDVRTMRSRHPRAEAIAVRAGVITAVGGTREIRRLAGKRTRTIDLAGHSVLPGINDAHVHALAAGVSLPPLSLDVAYPAVTSIADIVRLVGDAVAAAPAGGWVRGSGWNLALLEETRAGTRQPAAADLDPVSASVPVVLRDFSFHTVWANSAAMRAAGITASTADPPGGHIARDASGAPTGLFEEGAQALILEAMPALTTEQLQAGLTAAIEVLLAQGVTSYTDPGLVAAELELYRGAAPTLAARAQLMLSSSRSLTVGGTGQGSVDTLRSLLTSYPRPVEFRRRRVGVSGVKIFADGIPPYLSGWVYDPYVGTDLTGGLVLAGDTEAEQIAELRGIVALAHSAGFQVGTHATGDRTLDTVVAAYLAALRADRRHRDPRHYTIHSDLISDQALARLSRHGLGANMNPSIKSAIADAMIGVLGAERAARQWPTRSALDAGVTLTSSSDWPVGPPDWRAGVVNAVRRRDQLSGNVSGPDQVLTMMEALHTYTVAPAYQEHAERWKGRIAVGMVADLCVLDGTLPDSDAEVESLLETPVALTLVDGAVVYQRSATRTGATAAASSSAVASLGGAGASCATHANTGALCCCTRAPQLLSGQG